MPNGERILVVDDDLDVLSVMRDLLIDEGYEVRTAGNGREALDVLAEWRPDLIVLDLMMPIMDGPTFRRRQRELDLAPGVPLLVLSAARNMLDVVTQIGANGCLSKPFSLDEVLSTIETLLTGSVAGPADKTGAQGEEEPDLV